MHLIEVRNVHQALPEGCRKISLWGEERGSRNGRVKMLSRPLATTYQKPRERVIFHPERDANPYFHLMESLWMLGGRNDVKFVSEFNSQIHVFSDDGDVINGAYGYRWRYQFGQDQLDRVVSALRENPDCRRQVIAMWDARTDLGSSSKDVPCNVIATVQIAPDGKLDLMVSNRSNDMIWGAYGANAVHFSVLLEYLAHRIPAPVGRYYQVSANTHIYERHFQLAQNLANEAPTAFDEHQCPYSLGIVEPTPLFDPIIGTRHWKDDLKFFLNEEKTDYLHHTFYYFEALRNSWRAYKQRDFDTAMEHLEHLPEKSDWRFACTEWLARRML